MTDEHPPERARLLALVGVASAVLFVVTITLVVLAQTFGPSFGLAVGAPSDGVIGSMLVWAGIALGILPVALWRRR